MGILDHSMVSLCLFDVYRGNFADKSMRVKSSGVSSDVQAAAKLSLMAFLLENVAGTHTVESTDVSLKPFLSEMVTGIHVEFNCGDAITGNIDLSVLPDGIDKHMTSQEYVKLSHSC